MNSRTKKKWLDIAERAAKTFIEVFLTSIPIDATLLASGWSVWRATLYSATAAGISAVINLAIHEIRKERNHDYSEG